jgi:hypothetical protein
VSASFLILLASAAIAAVSALVAVRVILRDRRRDAARIAALGSAIDADPDIAFSRSTQAVPVAGLFESREHDSGWSLRLAAGVVAAIVVIGVVVMSSRQGASEAPSQARAQAAQNTAPLELVSMRHERRGGTLVITGFVRNPREGAPVSDLTAVVFAFDKEGSYIATGRAPIDFPTLEPGSGSPFVVSVPARGGVARYRVAFRHGDTVVRHLDKRAEPVSLASIRR